jgi:hypothetical protein
VVGDSDSEKEEEEEEEVFEERRRLRIAFNSESILTCVVRSLPVAEGYQ